MPTYDYVCDACDHRFELFQSITADPEKKCPACGRRKLRRLIGIGAAVLVGGGSSSRDDSESASSSSTSDDATTSTESGSGGDAGTGDAAGGTKGETPTTGPGKEKKISGSTSTPTHEAREGRGVGNLVDAVRRQRRESGDGKTGGAAKKSTTSKKSTTRKTSGSKPKASGRSGSKKSGAKKSGSRKSGG